MEKFNNAPAPRNSAKESLISVFRSEEPVHGSGYEPLTSQGRADVEALLSQAGLSLSDPLLEQLPGETLKELFEYGSGEIAPNERAAAAARIKSAAEDVRAIYYREAA